MVAVTPNPMLPLFAAAPQPRSQRASACLSRLCWVLVALLALQGLALGAPARLRGPVTLLSDPIGAEVFIPDALRPDQAEMRIGRADGRTVVFTGSECVPSRTYTLIYRLQDHTPATVALVQRDGGWSQPQSEIRLQPATFVGQVTRWARRYPAFVLLGVLSLGGGLAFLVARWRPRAAAEVFTEPDVQVVVPGVVKDPWIGREVGGYRLVRKLGEGGMARVYLGQPSSSSVGAEFCAVKIMHEDLARSQENRRRIDREMKICMQMDHPNVVRMLAGSTDGEVVYNVLELVSGTLLSEHIVPEGLPASRVLRMLLPILRGVDHAHSLGIVHRDLKPDNVMITDGGIVKVMDFGLARAVEGSKITATGKFVGTPLYISPEQISGEVDARSDQYALGIIAYEMLVGEPPFLGNNLAEVLTKHLKAPVPDIRTLRPDIPEALVAAIERMLAKEPAERFANVDEIVRTLGRIHL